MLHALLPAQPWTQGHAELPMRQTARLAPFLNVDTEAAGGSTLLHGLSAQDVLLTAPSADLFSVLQRYHFGGSGESCCSCVQLPVAPRGGERLQHPALTGVFWLGSQPYHDGAAAHQPAPWHPALDGSQLGEEAAWLAASSQCPSCQPGGRAETPCP